MCIVLSYNDSVVVFRSKSSLFFRFYKEKNNFFCVLTFDFLDSAEEIGEGFLMLNLGLRKTEKSAFVCAEENGVFFATNPTQTTPF